MSGAHACNQTLSKVSGAVQKPSHLNRFTFDTCLSTAIWTNRQDHVAKWMYDFFSILSQYIFAFLKCVGKQVTPDEWSGRESTLLTGITDSSICIQAYLPFTRIYINHGLALSTMCVDLMLSRKVSLITDDAHNFCKANNGIDRQI